MAGLSQVYAYTESDSNDANGPDYDWIEIRETGEMLLGQNVLGGGAVVALPVPSVMMSK